jgi:putative addiction module component (TIGR02574 family)
VAAWGDRKEGRYTVRVADIPGFTDLNGSEKLLLAEEIWGSLTRDETSVPVPASHVEELDKRLARQRANPGPLLTLEELQQRVASRR